MAKAKPRPARRRTVVIISGVVAVVAIAVVVIALVALRKPSGDTSKFDYASQPMLGNPRAPVKVVEFFDYKCPSCKWFQDNVFPLLKKQYIDTGIVQYYAMNFPFIGPDSMTAALAGEAVYHLDPEGFWTFSDALFARQGDEKSNWATVDTLVAIAKQALPKLNTDALATAITDRTYQNDVEADFLAGQLAGVNGTPTLYVNGRELSDYTNFSALQSLIKAAE